MKIYYIKEVIDYCIKENSFKVIFSYKSEVKFFFFHFLFQIFINHICINDINLRGQTQWKNERKKKIILKEKLKSKFLFCIIFSFRKIFVIILCCEKS